MQIADFNTSYHLRHPALKPYFMKINNEIKGICTLKHYNDNFNVKPNETKEKWIKVSFGDNGQPPNCKISFNANEDSKITEVVLQLTMTRTTKQNPQNTPYI